MRRPAAVASAMGALYEPFSYVAFFFRRPDDGVFRIVHPSLPAGRVGTRAPARPDGNAQFAIMERPCPVFNIQHSEFNIVFPGGLV